MTIVLFQKIHIPLNDTDVPHKQKSRLNIRLKEAVKAFGIFNSCNQPVFMQPADKFLMRIQCFFSSLFSSIGKTKTIKKRGFSKNTYVFLWFLIFSTRVYSLVLHNSNLTCRNVK